MNAAHVHLVLNTIPGIGTSLAIAALLYGMARSSVEVVRFGLLLFVVVALITIGVYASGKRTITVVGDVQGVIVPNIEAHEHAAKYALIALEITGAVALSLLLSTLRRAKIPAALTVLMVVISLASLSVVMYTSVLGGHIHHPETGGNNAVIQLPEVEPAKR